MSLIKLDFISFYFIILGGLFFLFWPFWLLIQHALLGFASSSLSIEINNQAKRQNFSG